jgi:hypothetical protein
VWAAVVVAIAATVAAVIIMKISPPNIKEKNCSSFYARMGNPT